MGGNCKGHMHDCNAFQLRAMIGSCQDPRLCALRIETMWMAGSHYRLCLACRLVAGFFSGFAFTAVSNPAAGDPLTKKFIACFNSGVLFALAQGAFYQVSFLTNLFPSCCSKISRLLIKQLMLCLDARVCSKQIMVLSWAETAGGRLKMWNA